MVKKFCNSSIYAEPSCAVGFPGFTFFPSTRQHFPIRSRVVSDERTTMNGDERGTHSAARCIASVASHAAAWFSRRQRSAYRTLASETEPGAIIQEQINDMLYLARRAAMCISIHTYTYGPASDFCSLAVFQPKLPLPLKLSEHPFGRYYSFAQIRYVRSRSIYDTYIHPAYMPIAFAVRQRAYT